MVSSVFPDGQLFRIITDSGEWAFYNDSLYYDMHLRYVFSKDCKIKPNLACTATERSDGSLEVSHVLHPEETVTLFSGTVTNFENLSKPVLLSDRYVCPHKDMYAKQDGELAKIQAALKEAGVKEDDVHAETVLGLCLQAELSFVDVDFFPNHGSLFRPGVDIISVPPLPWRVPADYLPPGHAATVHLMRGPTAANVIRQGSRFANSQFISALRVLAEQPGSMNSLFYHSNSAKIGKQERRAGAYRVQLCCSGWWTGTIVDKYFPASAHAPEFATCGDDIQALWVSVLEKAYAKHFGSYSAMQLSSVENTLMDFSGCPCTSLSSVWPLPRPSSAEVHTFVETLRAHLRRSGHVILRTFPLHKMTAQPNKDELAASYEELGLQPGHGVRVLGLETVGKCTLLRIRQAAQGEQNSFLDRTGKWLKVWTDAKKPWVDDVWSIVFGLDETSVLWMEAADVSRYFHSGFLLYPVNTNAEIRAKGAFNGARPNVCIKMTVKSDTRVIFSVQQPDVLLATRKEARRDSKGAVAPPQRGVHLERGGLCGHRRAALRHQQEEEGQGRVGAGQ
ncbi:calpain-like cysteine peptidase [Strigomonas culicis]|uniref:Calpain-like cysteine peptidase n=1 Tax=Strigomonas culicis TaxID=28005 RepID=S9VQ57_9TRYP|nr:calpain-like cysteine peptidase [Strigomonas culicis]|eukprot:EPY29211.1 calpain-like cysteine peptidase [Strigomonas culicis]